MHKISSVSKAQNLQQKHCAGKKCDRDVLVHQPYVGMSKSLFLEVFFFLHSTRKKGKKSLLSLFCLLALVFLLLKLLFHFTLKRSGKNVFKKERERARSLLQIDNTSWKFFWWCMKMKSRKKYYRKMLLNISRLVFVV